MTGGTYSYDAAGNLLNDGTYAYAYDAEGRISAAAGFYHTYDGDGRRVKKSNGTTGRLYWYAVFGVPLVETDLNASMQLEHFYFGGKRIAYGDWATSKISWVFSDHLDSARVKASWEGVIEQESDFYPFGGERVITSGPYDKFYKFTGKERDQETGLDYFSTRYYANTLGRFMSVDPGNIQGKLEPDNPQNWNAYAYAGNNPLKYVDPDGLRYRICNPDGGCAEFDDDYIRNTLLNKKLNPDVTFKGGNILANGEVIGTYERLSFDDLSAYGNAFYNQMAARRQASNQLIGAFAGVSAAAGTGAGVAAYGLGISLGGGVTTLGLAGSSSTILSNAAAGQIIGWGVGQAGAEVTRQLARTLTREAVEQMIAKGLTLATVQHQPFKGDCFHG